MQLLRSGSQSSLSVSKSIRKKGTWPCNGVDMIIIGGNVAVAFVGSWPFHSQLVSPAVTSLSRDIWTPEIFRPPMQTLKTNPATQTLETNPANHLQWTLRITETLVHRLLSFIRGMSFIGVFYFSHPPPPLHLILIL